MKKQKNASDEVATVSSKAAPARKFACRLKKSEITQLSPTKIVSAERAEILALHFDCPLSPAGSSEVALHEFLIGQLLPCQKVRLAAVRWGTVITCESREDIPEALAAILRKILTT